MESVSGGNAWIDSYLEALVSGKACKEEEKNEQNVLSIPALSLHLSQLAPCPWSSVPFCSAI
jgi:hypothetical protein